MARIQIEWVTWRKPPKLGAKAFEYLKVQLDEAKVCKRSFEDFRMMLNPEFQGKEDFVCQLKHEGKFYAAALFIGTLLACTKGLGR